MNWKATTEALTSVGVILGLVFVGFEVRQNTSALRSQAVQGIAEMSLDYTGLGVENAELREAYSKALEQAPETLSQEEHELLNWWMAGNLRIVENRYRQFELGTLEDPRTAGGNSPIYRSYFFRWWWETQSPGREQHQGTPFGEWMEREVLPGAPTEPPRPD